MHYMMLFAEPRGQRLERTPDEGRAVYAEMVAFAEGLAGKGILSSVESLQPESSAVRLEVRNGVRRTLDGPFSESKEMIGGFMVVDCATMEEALDLAAQCPAARWATVEVRPCGPCFM
ncbi:YciI family protein [soil metagenome]